MAGRGRGVVLNELLKESSTASHSLGASSQQQGEIKTGDNINEEQPPARLGVFAKRPVNNPLPSGGRGLMTPNQFMNSRPLNFQKTSALISAEEYLQATVYKPAPVDWQARQTSFAPQEPKKAPSVKATNAKFPSASQMRPQTAAPTMREKAEADAEWQKYKFQRQILGILSKVSSENVDDVFDDLKRKLDECCLSLKYPQFSEIGLVLESLIDKSTQSDSFIDISNHLIRKIAEYDVMQFELVFAPLVSIKTSEHIQVTASDKKITSRAKRFCALLGTIFKSVFVSNNDRLLTLITSCLHECIEQWTYPDGIGSEVEGLSITKSEAHAHAALELFKAMELQNFERDRVDQLMVDLESTIELLKESVLNDFLPRKVREVYLNLLLAYAPRCQFTMAQENETKIDTSHSERGRSSLSESTDFANAGTRSEESSQSSDATPIKRPEERLPTQANEMREDRECPGLTVDGRSELKKRNVCDYDFDDADSSVIVECIESEDLETNDFPNADEVEQTIDCEDYAEKESERDEWEDSENVETTGDDSMEDNVDKGPFDEIKKILKDLQLEDQLQRFEDNVIRDTVLGADKKILKNILKESAFPAGVIYEIMLYLDKNQTEQRNHSNDESGGRGNPSGPFASSQIRFRNFRNAASNSRQENTGLQSSKKRLLGIGRGGSLNDNRPRTGNRPRAALWKNSKTTDKEFSTQRKSAVDEDEDWRARRTMDQRQKSSTGIENVSTKSPYKQNLSYDVEVREETRQVGKVEPLQRSSTIDADEKESRTLAAPPRGFGFGSRPPACLRCGDKSHMSHECTNIKAMFI